LASSSGSLGCITGKAPRNGIRKQDIRNICEIQDIARWTRIRSIRRKDARQNRQKWKTKHLGGPQNVVAENRHRYRTRIGTLDKIHDPIQKNEEEEEEEYYIQFPDCVYIRYFFSQRVLKRTFPISDRRKMSLCLMYILSFGEVAKLARWEDHVRSQGLKRLSSSTNTRPS